MSAESYLCKWTFLCQLLLPWMPSIWLRKENQIISVDGCLIAFYRAMLRRARYSYGKSSVRPSVTLVNFGHKERSINSANPLTVGRHGTDRLDDVVQHLMRPLAGPLNKLYAVRQYKMHLETRVRGHSRSLEMTPLLAAPASMDWNGGLCKSKLA